MGIPALREKEIPALREKGTRRAIEQYEQALDVHREIGRATFPTEY